MAASSRVRTCLGSLGARKPPQGTVAHPLVGRYASTEPCPRSNRGAKRQAAGGCAWQEQSSPPAGGARRARLRPFGRKPSLPISRSRRSGRHVAVAQHRRHVEGSPSRSARPASLVVRPDAGHVVVDHVTYVSTSRCLALNALVATIAGARVAAGDECVSASTSAASAADMPAAAAHAQ